MTGVSPPWVALRGVGTTTSHSRGVDLSFAGEGGVFPTFCRYPQHLGAAMGEEPSGCAWEQQSCPLSPSLRAYSSWKLLLVLWLHLIPPGDPFPGKSLPALLLAARLQPKLPFPGISGTSQPGVPKQLHPSPFPEYKCHRASSHRIPGEDGGDREGPSSPVPQRGSRGGGQ